MNNAFNPMNTMYNTYTSSYQMAQAQMSQLYNNNLPAQTQSSAITFVNGLEGAKGYMLALNSTIILMDSDSSKFYIKATDGVAHDDAMDKINDSIVAYKKAKEDFNKKNDATTKNAMINALQELMDSYNYAIHGTWDGTDTNEERALIKEYTSKRFSGSLT